MTSEVGGLGDGFPGEILDGFGLMTSAALKYHPMKVPQERSSGLIGAIPVGFVREQHPDVIVSYLIFAEDVLRNAAALGYIDSTYPPLLPSVLAHTPNAFGLGYLHVLVAQQSRCSYDQVTAEVSRANR